MTDKNDYQKWRDEKLKVIPVLRDDIAEYMDEAFAKGGERDVVRPVARDEPFVRHYCTRCSGYVKRLWAHCPCGSPLDWSDK